MRITIHTRKTHRLVFGAFWGVKRGVLRLRRENRAEGLSGGARNGCYGKSGG